MIPVFALQLICGLSTVWTIAPRKEITSGFFRIQMLLALGLSVLLFLTSDQILVQNVSWVVIPTLTVAASILLAGLSFCGSVAWTLERRKGGAIFGGVIALLSTLCLAYLVISAESSVKLQSLKLLEILNHFTAAWLIGSATAAMLIGHWYLTATGMKLDPFIKYNRLFIVACVLRIASVLAFYLYAQAIPDSNWSLLTLRWAGLIGPFIMAILTIQILKYRNTQSATGLLYAATTLVFMGEMASNLID